MIRLIFIVGGAGLLLLIPVHHHAGSIKKLTSATPVSCVYNQSTTRHVCQTIEGILPEANGLSNVANPSFFAEETNTTLNLVMRMTRIDKEGPFYGAPQTAHG